MYLVIQCQQNRAFTKHQLNIKHKLQKRYGSVGSRNINYQKTVLQQELKATSERLKYQKRLSERRTLNKRLTMNPKSVYRQMKGDNKSAKKIPLKEDVESYWKELWSKEVIHNDKAPWLGTLGQEYCTNVQQTQYTFNEETFGKVVNKMKSPMI